MRDTARVTLIKERLTQALQPSFLSVEDGSAAHAHHAGARQSGGGHFRVTLVSAHFEGKSSVQRHQLVYVALNGLIGPEIHAIQITAKTPLEQ